MIGNLKMHGHTNTDVPIFKHILTLKKTRINYWSKNASDENVNVKFS